MPQSLSNVLLHVVFSTKHRQAFIDEAIEPELHAYLATICKTLKCPPHKIGGAGDHVHIACSLGRTIAVANLIQELKQDTSKWMKTKGARYRAFAWQNGYGVFSVAQSQLEQLRRYIENQRAHHQQVSFQDEFRGLLEKYRVPFDEHYVWD